MQDIQPKFLLAELKSLLSVQNLYVAKAGLVVYAKDLKYLRTVIKNHLHVHLKKINYQKHNLLAHIKTNAQKMLMTDLPIVGYLHTLFFVLLMIDGLLAKHTDIKNWDQQSELLVS